MLDRTQPAMNTFDPLTCQLTGINLIDASAGTGKTYTICGLLLRLLLEEDFAIQQILVVTYTEAATEDLRDRIRKKLREALTAFMTGDSEDEFLAALLQRFADHGLVRQRLTEALHGFDEAGIFTIHGFCQRMLRENSLESGVFFDTELVVDVEQLRREIVEDFWRRHFYQGSGLFVDYARRRITPDSFYALLREHQAKPYLQIIPEIAVKDAGAGLTEMEGDFSRAFRAMCRAWPAACHDVERILLNDENLKQTSYKRGGIPALIDAMEALASAARPTLDLFKKFEKFTATGIAVGTKKNKPPPRLPFFDLCEVVQQTRQNLLDRFELCLKALKNELFAYYKKELAVRKDRLQIYFFDDLLVQLHKGLTGRHGSLLAAAVAGKYPVALIDEFQDTDPIQYEIFQLIYKNNGRLLFLIGDPKQAIYSFRGADIFAYMQAAARASANGCRHTLGTNWRSTPGLIRAVNAIFKEGRAPFIFKEIPFQPVAAAAKDDSLALRINGKIEAPFHLWVPGGAELQAEPEQKVMRTAIPQGKARDIILPAMAAEVVRLLNLGREQKALLGDRPLAPGDIAILVLTNREARLTQQQLAACGVPCVLHSMESLFVSHEAEEMERLLAALAAPGNDRKIKAALATDIMGVSGVELEKLNHDEVAWEEWLTGFRYFFELWERAGFVAMFRAFMADNRIRSRLLGFTDGERRLTNLLHLVEVLHQAVVTRHLNIAGLLKYLAEQRRERQAVNEEHQLRLESDADCVRIVTVHKAKGLEYPVVFCPFLWRGSRITTKKEFTFHRREKGYRLVLDIGSPDQEEHRQQAAGEELAENLRLLYVALTRAIHRCYLVWGPIRGAETSAPAYLFHQPRPRRPAADSFSLMAATAERLAGLTGSEMWQDLKRLVTAGDGSIRLRALPDAAPAAYTSPAGGGVAPHCRRFAGLIDTSWQVTSFSAITAGRPLAQHRFAEQLQGEPGATIFDFPHGARPGVFLHDLLEHLDFTNNEAAQTSMLMRDKLQEYGFDPLWRDVIQAMIDNLCATPLLASRPDLRLGRVAARQRLNELEFYFPLAAVTIRDFIRIFKKNGSAAGLAEELGGISSVRMQGFMKGFIDLVFEFDGRYYLVDWKSNFLGNRPADYHRRQLAAVMQADLYTLQYHIYTVALHQYLAVRLPGYCYDKHFGGVFYIFLRGVDRDAGPDFGIYHDVPAAALIKELAALLISERDQRC